MKTGMTFSAVLALSVLLLLSTGAGTAHALYLGNPAPNFKKGDVGVGLSLSDLRDTAFLDWGLSDNGTLELLAGALDPGLDEIAGALEQWARLAQEGGAP